MAGPSIQIEGREDDLSLAVLRQAWSEPVTLELGRRAWEAVDAGSALVQRIVERGRPAYGINTGFGLLAQTRIDNAELSHLQSNLVLSHATGVGPPLAPEVVRLAMVLKVLSLCRGHSGVRRPVIEALLTLLARDVIPLVPARGSVGASGDLAPLAHMAAVLLGEGQAWLDGRQVSATDALKSCGIEPLSLGPKEGLALLNGTQISTALALAGLFRGERLFASAVVSGALSVDALQGSVAPFDPRIQALRRQPGQRDVAACYRELLEGSEILHSHLDCGKVQDPYSLRCQPQVMGACLDLLRNAAETLRLEANAVTDNPLLFPDTDEVLSGGNFHAQPVAFAADILALAIAEIGSMSERRTALLVDPKMSGLPPFLVENSGLNSGFMIAQVTAAALVSENKSIAHPASVDSIPTSANQEDHVSMATFAARRLGDMADNAAAVVAIELLAACQAVEFHRPHRSSDALQAVLSKVREVVGNYDSDRYFAPDIDATVKLVMSGELAPDQVRRVLPTHSR